MLLSLLLIAYAFIFSYLTGRFSWTQLQRIPGTLFAVLPHPALLTLIGMAGISWLVSVIHFFLPLNFLLHVGFLLMFGILFRTAILWLKELKNQLRPHYWFLLLAWIAAALAVVGRPGIGDIADYHLQAIKWAEVFPNIPGLGHFNRPLANNNWWFNLQAFFGFSWLGVKSVYVCNATLFLTVFFWFISSETISTGHRLARFIFLAFLLLSLNVAFVGAVTADYLITLMIFVLMDLFLIAYQPEKENDNNWVGIMILFIAWAVTAKATALVFFLLPLPIIWAIIRQKGFPMVITGISIITLFLLPWLIGNVLVSGYLLYPFHEIDWFQVDWKLPASLPAMEREIVKYWARIPDQNIQLTKTIPFTNWFPLWLGRLDLLNKALFFFFMGAVGLLVPGAFKRREVGWILLFLLIGFLVVFLNGPHPRFLFGYMVGGVALLVYVFSDRLKRLHFDYLVPNLLILCTGILIIKLIGTQHSADILFAPPAYPKPTLEKIEFGNFSASYDRNGRQCWDCFPCTYYLSDSIELRGKEVSSGFRSLRK